jgi:hypothetical protein
VPRRTAERHRRALLAAGVLAELPRPGLPPWTGWAMPLDAAK